MPKANSVEKKHFTERLAKHIQKRRKQAGLTQEELADRSGLNSAYVGHLERGVYTASIFVIWKIAKAMNTRIEEFIKDF